MTRFSTILAAAMAVGLMGTPVLAAQVTKTWVSSTTGNDTGTCPFTAPCKTFAFALTQTAPGGEIDVKDGGSYGPVTIKQAVSIVGEGVLAAISVPQGGTGVTVTAGASDQVILQGLVIDGHGLGSTGIYFTVGANLTVQQCQIRNLTADGIVIGGEAKMYHLVETSVSNAGHGVEIGYANGSISRFNSYGSQYGLSVTYSNVTVIDSTFSGNQIGILSLDKGNVLLGQSTVSNNTNYGIQVNGGIVGSYGNNYINANATDISGALGSVAER